ncbi:50S ribosomal protein L4 [bacterium]|nr:50S ribosomal protein L4 [bacterium]|tara:strand:+ start:5696 stop:6355 length:660 start_codon:yes stop_codon:yes gene_type:complete
METQVYDQKGKAAGNIKLPDEVFGVRWNSDLVHQVVVSMQSNRRAGTAHTKDRSEVSGGGKKPWRQKGTGRARHGSIRSPIWVGGGVTFGPRKDKDYDKKINKKMKTKALFALLSKKAKDGEILFVKDLATEAKTKTGVEFLKALSAVKGFEKIAYKTGRRALIVTPEKNTDIERAFRNVKSVEASELRNMNPLEVITYKYIVFVKPEDSVKGLVARAK